ncbi:hypothetical protein FHG87_002528 [Trinorchestia longiramus]|nr:hypothetical protein FHG87_002528 [Trinorchestia longiramus]
MQILCKITTGCSKQCRPTTAINYDPSQHRPNADHLLGPTNQTRHDTNQFEPASCTQDYGQDGPMMLPGVHHRLRPDNKHGGHEDGSLLDGALPFLGLSKAPTAASTSVKSGGCGEQEKLCVSENHFSSQKYEQLAGNDRSLPVLWKKIEILLVLNFALGNSGALLEPSYGAGGGGGVGWQVGGGVGWQVGGGVGWQVGGGIRWQVGRGG